MTLFRRLRHTLANRPWQQPAPCAFTHQALINAVAAVYGDGYWDPITNAGLAWLVEDREAIYTGPALAGLFPPLYYQLIMTQLCDEPADPARWATRDGALFYAGRPVTWLSAANLRSAAYVNFPHLGITQHGTDEDVAHTLDILKAAGVKVVRFYVAASKRADGSPGTDTALAIQRAKRMLAHLRERDMDGWLVLTDNQSSGLHVHSAYKDGEGYMTHWYREAYKTDFLPFVRQVVSAIGDAVFCYEIANEYQINTDNSRINTTPPRHVAQDMLNFTKTVKREIHTLAPHALVTPGFEALWNVFVEHTEFHGPMVELFQDRGFISPHTYIVPRRGWLGLGHNDRNTRALITLCNRMGVPVMVGEIGVSRPPDDTTSHTHLRAAYAELQRLGVRGAALWGVMPSQRDNGWADPEGWTRALHRDYDAMHAILQDYPTRYR